MSDELQLLASAPRLRRRASRGLTMALLPALAVLGAACMTTVVTGIPFSEFVQDPAAYVGYPWYIGVVSFLGVLMWCAAATLCLFTAAVLRERSSRRVRRFLICSGLLSLLLMLDDLLMFHDNLFPLTLGVSEDLVVGVLVVICLGYFVGFRRNLMAGDWPVLLVAVGLLGASVAIDATKLQRLRFLLEDGSKLMGLAAWLSYFVMTCQRLLGQALRQARPARERAAATLRAPARRERLEASSRVVSRV